MAIKGKGDVRTTGRKNSRSSGGSVSVDEHRSIPGTQATPRRNEAYREALLGLMLRDDGWLRAVPNGDKTKVFLKWKFTRGQWAGHYVMAVVDPYEVEAGYVLLLTKVVGAMHGLYRPTVDTPYD